MIGSGKRPSPVVAKIRKDFTFSCLCSCIESLTRFGFIMEVIFSSIEEAGGWAVSWICHVVDEGGRGNAMERFCVR